ncbi:hypothetical protein [Flammeovirga kamogawensis]|uniref:Arylsulfatase n=1 Tax=Flammeovirga kamogawensis TaxID=373891 RepID=A0ABX8H1A0_9BACT|nr:hypothetical protein [Flammeovirga kamogawensis]MBB6462584.1 hypothetical protein [Flammeovirga kamogawensis]QWG09669.1 hypothetical protein KM029_24000 [Flammeovirga kamogawensis]TRX65183.1 hypothetical protein EO216_21900 [Flammeovirga kamogawensis]
MIIFLHTSSIHIDRFNQIIHKFSPNTFVKHYVFDQLLENALENKALDFDGFKKAIAKIKNENSKLDQIICTCSTYGGLCNTKEKVFRIDAPVVDFLVTNYSKIALVYTAHSTRQSSKEIITKSSLKFQKEVLITDCDCSNCWTYFEKGDLTSYYKNIAANIIQVANKVDAIFLAQASMEGVINYLPQLKSKLFSSAEFGVKTLLSID